MTTSVKKNVNKKKTITTVKAPSQGNFINLYKIFQHGFLKKVKKGQGLKKINDHSEISLKCCGSDIAINKMFIPELIAYSEVGRNEIFKEVIFYDIDINRK